MKRFFYALFLAGVMGALRGAVLLYGKVNPVASVTLLIDLNGDSSQLTRGFHYATHYPYLSARLAL